MSVFVCSPKYNLGTYSRRFVHQSFYPLRIFVRNITSVVLNRNFMVCRILHTSPYPNGHCNACLYLLSYYSLILIYEGISVAKMDNFVANLTDGQHNFCHNAASFVYQSFCPFLFSISIE